MMVGNAAAASDKDNSGKKSDGKVKVMEMVTNMFSQMNSNDLKSLKKYLDSDESGIRKVYDCSRVYVWSDTADLQTGCRQCASGESGSGICGTWTWIDRGNEQYDVFDDEHQCVL